MTAWNRREWLSKAGMGAATLALAPEWLASGLLAEEPHIHISPLNLLTDEDEIALGHQFAVEFEKEEAVISNTLTDRYLGKMVATLAAQSQRPTLPYSIKLINSHVPNALSLPGGFLYVNRGLIEMIASEDELAAALSHEIGHVVARHVVNKLLMAFAAQSVLKPVLDNLNEKNGVIEKIILKFGGAAAMLASLPLTAGTSQRPTCWAFTICCGPAGIRTGSSSCLRSWMHWRSRRTVLQFPSCPIIRRRRSGRRPSETN